VTAIREEFEGKTKAQSGRNTIFSENY